MKVQHAVALGMGWDPPGDPTSEGRCGWCGDGGELWQALPSEFTQWNEIGVSPMDPLLCRLCGAAMSALRPVRWPNLEVFFDGSASALETPDALKAALSTPTGPERAVLVQTNRQKRSLLSARWGHVATSFEGGAVVWTEDHVAGLGEAMTLRWEHGVSEKAFAERDLRASVLSASPDKRWLIDAWDRSAWWREHRPVFDVMMLATRQTKK